MSNKMSIRNHSADAFIPLLIFVFLLLSSYGCNKMPINGDLDGKWRVIEVEKDGEILEFPQDARFYYNFYLHVCQLGREVGYIDAFTANMQYDGEFIHLEMPFVKDGNVSPSELNTLKYWGFPMSGEVMFHINRLTSSYLEMSYESEVVRCRKF